MRANSLIDSHPSKWTRFCRKLDWLFRVYLPPRRIVSVLTRNGVLSFDSQDKTTGRLLWVYRQHEFDDISGVSEYLTQEGFRHPKKNTLLDVGGYIGMTSIAFLRESYFERAVAIEASPANFALLELNLKQNQLVEFVTALNLAVGREDGEVIFELSSKNYGDNRIRKAALVSSQLMNEYGEATREVTVLPIRSLDSLVQAGVVDADKLGLIWMDIQGAEPEFFVGASNFFRQKHGVPVFFEFWPYGMERMGANLESVFSLIEAAFESFVNWNAADLIQRPISQLRELYHALKDKSLKDKEPGVGANVLLLPKRESL